MEQPDVQRHDPSVVGQLRSLGREVARSARQMTQHGYCDWMDNQNASRAGRGGAERAGAGRQPAVD